MGEIVGDKVFIEMSALSIRSWEVCAGGRPHRRGWVRGWARGSFSGWKSGVLFEKRRGVLRKSGWVLQQKRLCAPRRAAHEGQIGKRAELPCGAKLLAFTGSLAKEGYATHHGGGAINSRCALRFGSAERMGDYFERAFWL